MSRAAVALAAVVLVCACAPVAHAQVKSGDKRFTFTDSLPSFTPAPGHGLLCLVRELRVRAVAMKPERLYMDGAPLGYLAQASYLLVDLAPGMHRLEGVSGPVPVVISIGAGELRLLRLREVIDATDVLLLHWILDAPDAAKELVTGQGLSRSFITPTGIADLTRKHASLDVTARPDSIVPPSSERAVVQVPNIWFEHPLDQLNLRRDFSIYSGSLQLRADTIVYDMQKKKGAVHVGIPYAQIERVRYGGTRAVGLNPWIDVFYRGDDDAVWRASFADAGSQQPEANYNRLFALIDARRAALAGRPDVDAAPDSAAGR